MQTYAELEILPSVSYVPLRLGNRFAVEWEQCIKRGISRTGYVHRF
jgi:hypothetical protein